MLNIEEIKQTIEEDTGRTIKSIDTIKNCYTVEVIFYDSPNAEYYMIYPTN